MFEGFDPNTKRTDRRRFGMSLGISMMVYLPLIGGIVAASAHAVHKVSDEEKLVQVEFKEPPPPPPPPPPVEPPKPQKVLATKPARAKVERPELKAPDEIPDEKPPEADTALPEAPPVDQGQTGYLTGQIGGTGTGEVAPPPPPPPPKPKIVRKSDPVRDANFKLPEYPRSARRAGITGTVIARIHVDASGKVTSVQILEGPDVFHSYVKDALMAWRYTPARLSDGTTTADSHIVRIPFVLN